MYESGIPPVFKNINSVILYRTMKTVFILALIVAVCMCSVDVPGTVEPGEDEQYKPSSSARGEKSVQDDEQIRRAFIKKCRENPKLALQKMLEKAREEKEPKIEEVILMMTQKKQNNESLTEGEREKYKPYVCKIFGLGKTLDNNDVFRDTVMLFLKLLLDDGFLSRDLPGGLRDRARSVLELVANMVPQNSRASRGAGREEEGGCLASVADVTSK
jgi:hypothetical protein